MGALSRRVGDYVDAVLANAGTSRSKRNGQRIHGNEIDAADRQFRGGGPVTQLSTTIGGLLLGVGIPPWFNALTGVDGPSVTGLAAAAGVVMIGLGLVVWQFSR